MPESDQISCVVLGRNSPSQAWELITNTLRRSIAFRSAYYIQEQERSLGRRSYQAGVQTREDYDNGSKRFLKPPEGFEALIREEAVETYVEPTPPPRLANSPQVAEVGPLIDRPLAAPKTRMILTEPEL